MTTQSVAKIRILVLALGSLQAKAVYAATDLSPVNLLKKPYNGHLILSQKKKNSVIYSQDVYSGQTQITLSQYNSGTDETINILCPVTSKYNTSFKDQSLELDKDKVAIDFSGSSVIVADFAKKQCDQIVSYESETSSEYKQILGLIFDERSSAVYTQVKLTAKDGSYLGAEELRYDLLTGNHTTIYQYLETDGKYRSQIESGRGAARSSFFAKIVDRESLDRKLVFKTTERDNEYFIECGLAGEQCRKIMSYPAILDLTCQLSPGNCASRSSLQIKDLTWSPALNAYVLAIKDYSHQDMNVTVYKIENNLNTSILGEPFGADGGRIVSDDQKHLCYRQNNETRIMDLVTGSQQYANAGNYYTDICGSSYRLLSPDFQHYIANFTGNGTRYCDLQGNCTELGSLGASSTFPAVSWENSRIYVFSSPTGSEKAVIGTIDFSGKYEFIGNLPEPFESSNFYFSGNYEVNGNDSLITYKYSNFKHPETCGLFTVKIPALKH